MAENFTTIPYIVTTTLSEAYLASAATTILTGLQVANVHTSAAADVSIMLTRAGVDTYIVKGLTVPTGSAVGCLAQGHRFSLVPGDKIRVAGSMNGALQLLIGVSELS